MTFDTSAAKDWIDIREATAQLGISETTLRRMIAKREISYARFGSGFGRIRLSQGHLDEYMQRREVPAVVA